MSTLKRKSKGPLPDPKKAKPNASITSFFGTPKTSTTTTTTTTTTTAAATTGSFLASNAVAPPANKFDKGKWVEKLTDEQRELLQLEIDTLDESWLALLKDEITTKEFLELKRFLNREANAGKKVFPPREDIYSWSRHTPFHTVKVVILGQDPYHNVNQAHGLAFSVRPPTKAPPSLKNMYICLKNDYAKFTPPPNNSGLLTPWADRGVLMLNTCLTVRAHEANSHANRGWERFTQKVIDLVASRRSRGVVFMAWGSPAAKRVIKIDQQKHLVLKAVHPSPLSASRGFFDCGHFRKANEWLVQRYGAGEEIDWSLTEGVSLLPPKEEGAAEGQRKQQQQQQQQQQQNGGQANSSKQNNANSKNTTSTNNNNNNNNNNKHTKQRAQEEEDEFDIGEDDLEALEELKKIEDAQLGGKAAHQTATAEAAATKTGVEVKGDENKDPALAVTA